jgi:hypothetical protein
MSELFVMLVQGSLARRLMGMHAVHCVLGLFNGSVCGG